MMPCLERVTQKYDTDVPVPGGENKLSEILILCNQHTPVIDREVYNNGVIGSLMSIGNGRDIVPRLLECPDHTGIAVFIR